MSRICAAKICPLEIDAERAFCTHHWFLLSMPMRNLLNASARSIAKGSNPVIAKDYLDTVARAAAAVDLLEKDGLEHAKCSDEACGADIVFMLTRRNKWTPVEPSSINPGDRVYDSRVHRSHFADCPGAKRFRKAKRSTPGRFLR